MRKTISITTLFLFLTTGYADEGIYTFEKNKNIFFYSKNVDKVLQLTNTGKNSNPILSPDGRWLVFVKQSKNIMPEPCADFSNIDSKYANELWVYDLQNIKKRILVKDNFACDDPEKKITDPVQLHFSPNSKTLYFQTSAWATSGAIHAIDMDSKSPRFVTDGNEYHVIKDGKYEGDLVVNQHRYRFKGDTPLGSYDWDWLYTPQGKQIKLYKKED